ncbi:uncharacterized protein C8A04DRAFT_26998 [Dichotomopilus funicola]|uniref:NADH dehydrogenase [ubiquinone] 1 alpha subcomplex subunit 1 n=1 Tax=Dichotomopilus funicola TaxID=1934379 RepID=A0AAN6ZQ92_9PEZI|nr:hypothetical protein C8A04DRAFT_26998 [Dichotomopilus funicola]
MPVPFESLIPYGIIVVMFGVSGAGLNKIKNMQSGGKRHRWSIDQWDKYDDASRSERTSVWY